MLHKIVLTADDDNNSLTTENDDDSNNDNDDGGIRNSSSRSTDKDIDIGSRSSSSSKVGYDGSNDGYDDDDIVNNIHHLSVRVWKDTTSDKPLIEPISYGNACNL